MRRLTTLVPSPVWLQFTLVLTLGLALILWPPASGNLLLVPVFGDAQANTIARAVDGGARLVSSGLLPGSFVVNARRESIAPSMLRRGVLVFAGPAAGCSDTGRART